MGAGIVMKTIAIAALLPKVVQIPPESPCKLNLVLTSLQQRWKYKQSYEQQLVTQY